MHNIHKRRQRLIRCLQTKSEDSLNMHRSVFTPSVQTPDTKLTHTIQNTKEGTRAQTTTENEKKTVENRTTKGVGFRMRKSPKGHAIFRLGSNRH